MIRAAVENGADLIELGIPFSDPTAEGPVIQGANLRALTGGVTTDQIFAFVKELRRDVKVPMVFMTYANVVFSYGTERFLSRCKDAAIDGLILPDLPFEEKEEFLPFCRKYGVDLVSLIAPTSENRIARIAKEAEGFLIYRIQPGRDRRQKRNQDRPCFHCRNRQREHPGALRHRLWHFHTGAGKAHGRSFGWSHRRLRYCQTA